MHIVRGTYSGGGDIRKGELIALNCGQFPQNQTF